GAGRKTKTASLQDRPERKRRWSRPAPAFKTPPAEEPTYGLMSFSAEPTNLLIDGPFTAEGLKSLHGLDGLIGLSFFWHTSRLRGDDLQSLDGLSNLVYLGCQGQLCDDDAMRHIASLPSLRML